MPQPRKFKAPFEVVDLPSGSGYKVTDANGVNLAYVYARETKDAADPAFRGAGVLEVVDRFDGDTYRAMYTVKFEGMVYVLHAFQKKSKKGIATSKADIDLVKSRLKMAEEDYEKVVQKKTA